MKKNIETIERTIKEEKVTWVASDGSVFTDEENCKAWEKDYKCTLKIGFNKMKKFKVAPYEFGLNNESDEYITYIVKPCCEEDVIVLNGIRNVYGGDAYGDDVCFNDIGKQILVQFGWGNGDEIFGNEWIECRDFEQMKQERMNNWNKATKYFETEN